MTGLLLRAAPNPRKCECHEHCDWTAAQDTNQSHMLPPTQTIHPRLPVMANHRMAAIGRFLAVAALFVMCAPACQPLPVRKSTKRPKAGSAAQLQKACNDGDFAACTDLAWGYDQGEGVAQDHAKAAKLYKQACDGGNAKGCF